MAIIIVLNSYQSFSSHQAAMQSGPAGGVRHAVEEGHQHHHSGRADH